MSFLESGKTPRTMFSEMPPKRHDVETSKSEVLAYICEQMGCDMAKAVRLFNSMRHPKCRVLVFDKVERQWKGCSYRPADAETSELSILREHRLLERQVAAIKSELRRLAREVESLKKATRRKRGGDGNCEKAEDLKEQPKTQSESEAEPETFSSSIANDLEEIFGN